MLEMTLPALIKPELSDYVPTVASASRAAVSSNATPMNHFTGVLERLKDAESLFRDFREIALASQQSQLELQQRAEKAEAETARLEAELAQLKGQVDAIDRVPRWVRRVFGASGI